MNFELDRVLCMGMEATMCDRNVPGIRSWSPFSWQDQYEWSLPKNEGSKVETGRSLQFQIAKLNQHGTNLIESSSRRKNRGKLRVWYSLLKLVEDFLCCPTLKPLGVTRIPISPDPPADGPCEAHPSRMLVPFWFHVWVFPNPTEIHQLGGF